jgi:hypothetical protein
MPEEKIIYNKETAEALIVAIAEMKAELRKSKRLILGFVVGISLCVVGFGGWFYFRYSSPFVNFISEGDTKTLIGVKNAGRIQVDKDDRTGETIIEVYHATK